ncbi:hypothetical protein PoB_001448700 [Plakobranchus ocellatus]|uniref:Uncharacterized protein n=1 Tax=Plakobranchus ocellatus TaxID=259542 RepID=A0AAV3Z0H5_9GAST|nr:hypothetical protein PoB_001448700 [Plakobranchus ocellatus]
MAEAEGKQERTVAAVWRGCESSSPVKLHADLEGQRRELSAGGSSSTEQMTQPSDRSNLLQQFHSGIGDDYDILSLMGV